LHRNRSLQNIRNCKRPGEFYWAHLEHLLKGLGYSPVSEKSSGKLVSPFHIFTLSSLIEDWVISYLEQRAGEITIAIISNA
jgi:hypothetical protein